MIEMMANLSEATSGSQKEVNAKISNLIKNTALSYVTPYSGMAKFVNTELDASKANFGQERGEGLIDEMMKRFKYTYGISEGIPKRFGIFGQEIPYKRVMGWDVSDSAHEMFAGYSIDDPTIKELMKLTREDVMMNPDNYNEYSLDNTTMLKMPVRTVVAGGQLVKLTPNEYSEYVRLASGNGLGNNIKPLKQHLDDFISSAKYINLPAADRIAQINNIVRLYRSAAKGTIIKNNPAIEQEARNAMMLLQEEYNSIGR
jgi:hypothetical protein